MDLISDVLGIAAREVGVSEQPPGSNTSPRIQQYAARAGYGSSHVRWCLCFAYFCVDEACKESGIDNTLLRTGGCDELLAWSERKGIRHTVPVPGDIGLVLASATDATHAFLVEQVTGGVIRTIEGNLGNSVQRNSRPSDGLAYVRWVSIADSKVSKLVPVKKGGIEILQAPIVRGIARVPIREASLKLGRQDGAPIQNSDIGFDEAAQAVTIGGRMLPTQVEVVFNTAFGSFRALAEFLGWTVKYDEATGLINIS